MWVLLKMHSSSADDADSHSTTKQIWLTTCAAYISDNSDDYFIDMHEFTLLSFFII